MNQVPSRYTAASVLPSPSKSLVAGLSPLNPKRNAEDTPEEFDRYQMAVEGRKTPTSERPSPSKSKATGRGATNRAAKKLPSETPATIVFPSGSVTADEATVRVPSC